MNATALQTSMSHNGGPMLNRNKPQNWEALLASITAGKAIVEVGMNRNIFQQGDRAESVFYLKQGTVKLAVTSEEGKDAIFALAEAGEIFGEDAWPARVSGRRQPVR
jgi:CRP-like cAMP-binding protein